MMRTLLRTTDGYFVKGDTGFQAIGDLAAADLADATSKGGSPAVISGETKSPVDPEHFILVGLNYPAHAEESGMKIPNEPVMNASPAKDSNAASGSTVHRPEATPDYMDYEVEMAIIIGKSCENVDEIDASNAILGVTPLLDLSLRDVLFRAILAMREKREGPTMAQAKVFKDSKPLGPEVLLWDDAMREGLDMSLSIEINGKKRQKAQIAEMIFSPTKLVAAASKLKKLEAGDVICSGTPAGVGYIHGRFLEAGDEVIARLGDLEPLKITIA